MPTPSGMPSRVPIPAALAGRTGASPVGRSRRHNIKEELPMTADKIPDYPVWALRLLARAQLKEIDIFKWNLGVQLGHDPLLDRSMNEIAEEWITRHGAAFRAWWDDQNGF
jgi:hypothetical protein